MSNTPPSFRRVELDDRRCDKCKQIPHKSEIIHHNKLGLRISAARGCPICQFFYKNLCVDIPSGAHDRQYLKIDNFNYYTGTMQIVDYNNCTHSFEIFSKHLVEHGKKICNTYFPAGLGTFRPIQLHPDSEPCWDLAHRWFLRCTSGSGPCGRTCNQSPSRLPSRVLEVVPKLRLKVRESCSANENYAALSHCWGPESNIMKATTNNLKDLHMEIDESALSKSFRDAIKTTRILHIKYLWIDALCVVQDDVSDWHKEASQMGEYYKNAVLTLSALSAPNGDVGFLIPRRHECVQLEAGWGIRNASRPWEEVFENSPLSRRAWALQERLLSTRVLHFGNDEIFWECLSFSARESNYALKKEYPMSLETFEIIFQRSLPESGSRIRCRDAMRSWYEIVCKYSGLELTVQSDIFPGIAGIAQRFQQTTDFHYMAGLWLEHALCGLLWHADCVTEHKRLQEVPTWSWASLSGRVKMMRVMNELESGNHANPLNAEIVGSSASSPPQYLSASGAFIKLSALCFEVWCQSSKSPTGDSDFLSLVLDIFDDRGKQIGSGYWDRIPPTDIRKCTSIIIVSNYREDSSQAEVTYFLLAEAVGLGNSEQYYERLGVGQTFEPFHKKVFERSNFEGSERKTITLR